MKEKDLFHPHNSWKKIKNLTNAGGQQLVEEKPLNFLVQLIPDSSVERALFLPNKLRPGEYRAHPSTILALRKDIFVVSEDTIDLECHILCSSCKKIFDAQFWFFCPYCESSFVLSRDKI